MAQSAGRFTGKTRRLFGWLAALAIVGVLGACGGGGSDLAENRVTLPIGGGGGTGGGGGGTSTAGTVVVAVIDLATGAPTTTISSDRPAVARATVVDGDGAPVVNAFVRFEQAAGAGLALSPATALTDLLGRATVGVAPASPSASGAATVRAVATIGQQQLASVANVSITPTQVASNALTLTVADQASGQVQNSISFTALSVARAVVRDAGGQPLANVVVAFSSSDPTAVVFTPAATALTDSNGAAQVNVKPASLTTAGAYTLRAAADVGTQRADATFNVAIGAPQVGLGTLVAGQSPLSAYGTTVLSVPVTGVPVNTPIQVRFTSGCAEQNPARATIGALVTTVNGVARTTYVDRGCGSNDLVTASVEGTTVTRTGNLQVAAPAIANIQFVSASPFVIAQRGTGGTQGPGTGVRFPEIATVRFQVVDQAGVPVPTPTNVTLRLSNNTGGMLIDQVPGPVVKQTDADGIVEVQVQSGTMPTPVWVIATIGSGASMLTTNSVQLAVSTGQPIQNRFSLAPTIRNCEGWSYDGPCAVMGVIAGDAMGNPVPDGTAVSFISDAGVVEANCQTGVATGRPLPGDGTPGVCGVTLRAAGVRPPDGRLLVAAYAVGEEFYEDLNGNNRYDAGEPFYDQGYLFLDRNRNGAYDQPERFVPYLNAQSAACGPNPMTLSVPNTCDGAWGLAHVRDVTQMVFSGSFGYLRTSPTFALPNVSNIPTSYRLDPDSCSVQVPFWLQDLNGNPMPYDTRLAVRVTSSDGLSAYVTGDTVGSTSAVGGTRHRMDVFGRKEAGVCTGSGTAAILITTPRNNVTIFEVQVSP